MSAPPASGTGMLVALYRTPADPAAFDAYYTGTHAPLAKKLPGLQSFTFSKPTAKDAPYYAVAILTFADVAAVNAALATPEGVATAGDLENFAQAGVELMIFEAKAA